MLTLRDVPVIAYFTKNKLYREYYFDVGIGHTEFTLELNTQVKVGLIRGDMYYDTLLIGTMDWTDELVYISGSVDTDAGNPATSFLKLVLEANITSKTNWIYLINLVLRCDENSPAPSPQYVGNTPHGSIVYPDLTLPGWVTPEPTVTSFRSPTPTPSGYVPTTFDPSPINTVFPTIQWQGAWPEPGQTFPPTTEPPTTEPPTTTAEPTVTPTP